MSASSPQAHPFAQRGLIIAWLLYFFQFGAIGIYFPFLSIYFLQNGLSGTEIGLIGTASALMGVFGASLWGYLCDHTSQPRLLLAGGALGAALIVLAVPLVHSFWDYLALGCLSSLIGAGVPPMVDNITLTLLGNRSEEYGRYRLGGSVGYILSTAVAGVLFNRIGLQWIFILYVTIVALFSFTALFLPSMPIHLSTQNQKSIGTMIRRPTWLLFVASIFLVWIAASGIISFMSVALKSLGANEELIGLTASIGALVELPFMLFSGRWMKKYGTTTMLWFSMLAFTGRCVLYGLMPVPVWAVYIGMLNGPSYVFFWSSAVNYARQMAPEGFGATAQGMLNSVTNLASMASGLFCGLLFDQMGANGMFWGLGASCGLGFLIFRLGSLRQPHGGRGPGDT